jgi:hypothetical protein
MTPCNVFSAIELFKTPPRPLKLHTKAPAPSGLSLVSPEASRSGSFPMVSMMFAWEGSEGHRNIFNMNSHC